MKGFSTSVESINSKTDEIKEKSRKMYKQAQDIKNINNHGISAMDDLKTIHIDSVKQTEIVNDNYHELVNKIEDIKKISEAVSNISKQTHILAINASIEAICNYISDVDTSIGILNNENKIIHRNINEMNDIYDEFNASISEVAKVVENESNDISSINLVTEN